MSVGNAVLLPAQPTNGHTDERSLAGNGYYAPHSETRVHMSQEADGSAGFLTLGLTFDPKWSSVLAWVNIEITNVLVTKKVSVRLQTGEHVAMGSLLVVDPLIPGLGSVGAHAPVMWNPPPQLLFSPGIPNWTNNLQLICTNVDGEDVEMHVTLYNFKKDAGKVVPLNLIYSVLNRGGSVT